MEQLEYKNFEYTKRSDSTVRERTLEYTNEEQRITLLQQQQKKVLTVQVVECLKLTLLNKATKRFLK